MKIKTMSRNNGKARSMMIEPNVIEDRFSIVSISMQRKLTQSFAIQSIKLQIKSMLTLN